jgi:capsular exopolysaccharide synthesis family protein
VSPNATLNALALFQAFRRRWLLALSVGIVCAALAATGTYFFLPPPKHNVRTLLVVPPGSPFLFKTAEAIPDLASHQRTQVAMIKSRLVLNSALRDPEVARLKVVESRVEPVEWLEKEVQVDFSVAPEILRISMSDHTTAELVVLVNAIRTAYIKEVVERERQLRRERLAKLGELREKFEGQVRASRETQKDINAKLGANNAGVRAIMQAFVQQQLGMMERELLQTKLALDKARVDLTVLADSEKAFNNLSVSEEEVKDLINKDPAVQKLLEKSKELKQLIKETLERAARGENDPQVVANRTKLTKLGKDLAEEERRVRPDAVRQVRDRARADLLSRINIERGRVANLEATAKWLEPEVQRLQARVAEVAAQGFQQDAFNEDITQTLEMAKKISLEEQALKVELEVPSRVNVLQEATIYHGDATSRAIMMAALAALGGLGLVVFGVSWLECRAQRVETSEEVATGLGMRLVGTLPDSRGVRRRSKSGLLSGASDQQNLLAESVDSCRAMLLHLARQESLRVVMVTSAVSGEGKTSLSCHLAASVARAGQKVLLIDGDLRNPTVHRVFDIPNEAGLAELLRGEVQVEDVTRRTSVKGLSIIPGGAWDDPTAQALAQGSFGGLLEQLREQYEFILIDTSPVMPVSDALLIGHHVDGALLSVLRHVSRVPWVYAASVRVEAVAVRVLGVVLNGASGELYHPSGYRYRKQARTEKPAVPAEKNNGSS